MSCILLSGFLTAALLSATSQTSPAATEIRPVRATVGELSGDIEHGRYLAENVAMCVECHSARDARGNIVATRRYLGAPIPFQPAWPADWAPRAPRNRGLPGYDDTQAFRLLTEGSIDREGRQLRAPMPRYFMSRQDAADVIAYLRSLD